MTDYQAIVAAIKGAQERGQMQVKPVPQYRDPIPAADVELQGDRIVVTAGYDGFFVEMTFNQDGSLKGIFAWE